MFDEVYAVNVKAPFFLTAAIAPEMTARGSGSIINLGSWVARLGIPVGALYASTKGAMETLTRAWAAEFGSPGVRVNAISPGVVRTPIENDPAAAMMNGTPYGAFGTPDAIAHAAVYLACDESQFVNGTVIDVDGGRVGVAVIAAAITAIRERPRWASVEFEQDSSELGGTVAGDHVGGRDLPVPPGGRCLGPLGC